MRNITEESRLVMNTRRNFVNYAHVTLHDGTELNLTPSDFRISGNSFTDDWNEGESFQLGSAIGKTATLLLDNTDGRVENTFELQTAEPADWTTNYTNYYRLIEGFYYPIRDEELPIWFVDTYYTLTNTVTYPHGKFSEYDFYMAYFELYLHLPKSTHYQGELIDEVIPIGTFTVTTPASHGSTIEITGVDNMHMFDKSFDDCTLNFSTGPTLQTVLNRCCQDCGVAIGYSSFLNESIRVYKKPEGLTYRQVVSYIAQIAGCNAKISDTGALILRWYNTSVFADNWLDGGSFTAIGEEFQFQSPLHWDGTHASWGKVINYATNTLPRSGKYKLTRLHISNISDPSNFDADYQINQFQCLNYDSVYRFGKIVVLQNKLVEGDNIINYEFDISTLNRIVYWFGIVGNNYGDPNAATFDCTVYLEPVSYDDLDSADGGTFETEFQMYNPTRWTYDGQSTSTDNWNFYSNITYQFLKPAGRYNITRTFVDNIADPTHFNAIWTVQKSVDNGSTWTDEATGNLVAGDNIINFNVDIPENIETRYRVVYGQNVAIDPDASDFDATLYMKANDIHYLDGNNFDGGDFTTPLNYHNLTATNGTSVSTDDIHFTGIMVSYEVTNNEGNTEKQALHYPDVTDWDAYAMYIEDNPFVETQAIANTVATSVWDIISPLNFRPFSCSSIQDPTIEAGDCALVYDVKGNIYPTVVTNVRFTTGGMTEVSCTADPPVKQNSRYVNPAAKAVAKAKENMNAYNTQVAHFNEIANAALGYYKTEEVDASTGATITYLHNKSTLESSNYVVKISSGVIAISDNYNTSERSWNSGVDMTTATMLMNLIYVHGLTADWIKTGTLTLGGFNNIDGVLYAYANIAVGTGTYNGSNVDVGVGWIQVLSAGTFPTSIYIDSISNPEKFKGRYTLYYTSDGGSSWTTIERKLLQAGENKISPVTIVSGDTSKYYIVRFSMYSGGEGTYRYTVNVNKLVTTIDKNGITTTNGSFTGTITAKSGYIGNGSSGWTIGDTAIYNNCQNISDDLSRYPVGPSRTSVFGTYVGIDGIRNQYNLYSTSGSTPVTYNWFTRIYQGEIQTNSLKAEGGTIGSSATTGERWNIGAKSIWNGCGGVTSTAVGTYVGTDGIRNQGTNGKYIQLYQGKLTANSVEVNGGTLAGLTVELAEKGLSFNGTIGTPYAGTYHDVSHYFKISAYGGITAGRQMDSSNGDVRSGSSGWVRLDWVQGYGMLKVDFGPTSNPYRGIIVTNAGNNTYYDAGSSYIQIMSGSIWNNTNGKEAAWTTSDRRLKKDIKDLTLEESKNLINIARPRSFKLIKEDGIRYGFIAQELREVLDDDSGIEFTSEETGYHLVNYDDFIAPLCMIVKDQQEQIDRQQEEINDLKTRLERLESIVNTNK